MRLCATRAKIKVFINRICLFKLFVSSEIRFHNSSKKLNLIFQRFIFSLQCQIYESQFRVCLLQILNLNFKAYHTTFISPSHTSGTFSILNFPMLTIKYFLSFLYSNGLSSYRICIFPSLIGS